MNIKLLLLILPTVLPGCYQVVNRFDIDRANLKCAATHSSVESIIAKANGYETVVCSDGKAYSLENAPSKLSGSL